MPCIKTLTLDLHHCNSPVVGQSMYDDIEHEASSNSAYQMVKSSMSQ